jgi:nucleotide-binding universal stress UspA family protein
MTSYTVAVDDTDAGSRTVEWIDENICPGDRVRLLTVSELYSETVARTEQRLEQAETRLRRNHPGLVVQQSVSEGPTVERLLLDSKGSDALVLGARQAHVVLATLSGRIAERVVARTTVPVVAVPEHWHHGQGPVVVGVDGHTASAALAFAADQAAVRGSELVLVRAWDIPLTMSPYANIYLADDRELWEHESTLELQAASRAVAARHPDVVVREVRRHGQTAAALLEEAGENASLIVTGRRHRTAIGAFLGGSVGEALMHRSHAPVCIVPQPAAAVSAASLAVPTPVEVA